MQLVKAGETKVSQKVRHFQVPLVNTYDENYFVGYIENGYHKHSDYTRLMIQKISAVGAYTNATVIDKTAMLVIASGFVPPVAGSSLEAAKLHWYDSLPIALTDAAADLVTTPMQTIFQATNIESCIDIEPGHSHYIYFILGGVIDTDEAVSSNKDSLPAAITDEAPSLTLTVQLVDEITKTYKPTLNSLPTSVRS